MSEELDKMFTQFDTTLKRYAINLITSKDDKEKILSGINDLRSLSTQYAIELLADSLMHCDNLDYILTGIVEILKEEIEKKKDHTEKNRDITSATLKLMGILSDD